MRTLTTQHLKPAEQYSYWREVLCEEFTALDPVAEVRNSFDSSVVIKNLLDVTVSDVASKAQDVYRSAREISRKPSEFYFANMQLEGSCIVRQDGRETLMRPGDFYIVDTTRVYDLIFDDWRILCIRIPRHLLLPLLKGPRDVTAVRLHDDGGMGTIAGSFMRSLLLCPEAIPTAAQQTLIDSLANLLAIALGATAETQERGKEQVRQRLRDSIASYVASNIGNPDLGVSTVAGRFRISPRYLHKLFENQDQSFSHMVVERRLERCARELADPMQASRSISEIAYQWGFNDLSSFCRVFHKRYGMPARDYRLRQAKEARLTITK